MPCSSHLTTVSGRLTARRQHASGSTNDAVSSLMPGGRAKVACSTLGAGTRQSSAKPPGSRLMRLKARHMDALPRRQQWQGKQGTWWDTTTRWPTTNDVTAAPDALT